MRTCSWRARARTCAVAEHWFERAYSSNCNVRPGTQIVRTVMYLGQSKQQARRHSPAIQIRISVGPPRAQRKPIHCDLVRTHECARGLRLDTKASTIAHTHWSHKLRTYALLTAINWLCGACKNRVRISQRSESKATGTRRFRTKSKKASFQLQSP